MIIRNGSAKGCRHTQCEDAYENFADTKESLYATVVCDGVSACRLAAAGAKLTAEIVIAEVRKISKIKKEIFQNPTPFVEGVLESVKSGLEKFAVDQSTNVSELASTLACVIFYQNKYLVFAIGDSCVVIVKNPNHFFLLPNKIPKIGGNVTYSTMDLFKDDSSIITISKGEGIGAILMSDGFYLPLKQLNSKKNNEFKNELLANAFNIAGLYRLEVANDELGNIAQDLSSASFDDATISIMCPESLLAYLSTPDLVRAFALENAGLTYRERKQFSNKLLKTCAAIYKLQKRNRTPSIRAIGNRIKTNSFYVGFFLTQLQKAGILTQVNDGYYLSSLLPKSKK